MRSLNIEGEALKIMFTHVGLGPRNVSRSFCALGDKRNVWHLVLIKSAFHGYRG